ncbi:hypothetical protein BX600DRAFT_510947 [Xylariales sp. PMI_506]|nr:hypothetical protein BX600DRAFT_510947 [Xylariales sp. PMI_506]
MAFKLGKRLPHLQYKCCTPRVSARPRLLPRQLEVTCSNPAVMLLPNRPLRFASSSSEAQRRPQAKPEPSGTTLQSIATPLDATSPKHEPLVVDVAIASTLNPPATTRPPVLSLPSREPGSSLFTYLFSLGKAYTTFYKNGLKAIFTNRRLLRDATRTLHASPRFPSADVKVLPNRAYLLLRERTRHDMSRLPIFGLLVLVCGEFTPLVVLAFPKLTPYTCRIPKQIEKLRAKAQERRAASLRSLQYIADPAALDKVTPGHIVRTLGLGSSIWDKAGMDHPFATSMAARAVRRIVDDDNMISNGGGVKNLEPEEVVLACEDRAMDVRHQDVNVLRAKLGDWIATTTTKREGGDAEASVRGLLIRLSVSKK